MAPPRQRAARPDPQPPPEPKPAETTSGQLDPDGAAGAAGASLPLVEREPRGWLVSGVEAGPVRVRFLDQVEAETGLSLVEAGGTGARLHPAALGPGAGTSLVEEVATARATWDQITADLEDARLRWRLAARALSESGMNTTRISHLVGVSRAAVDKLLRRAAEDPADRMPTVSGLALVSEVEQAQAQVEEVTRRQTEFSARWAEVAFDLQHVLRSDRDVAFLLGVSRQRVHQLAQRVQQDQPGRPAPTGRTEQAAQPA